MDEILHLLSRIQETFSVLGSKCGDKTFLEFPQVVVIGNQGCGKSSVLERLVGRSFLPRGPGGVTRRPIVIQLVYSSKKELARVGNEVLHPKLEAWGCFSHRPERHYIKFDEMRQEILSETSRVAGESKDISTEPIHLKIYSNSVTLTFIDLPGLVRMPFGDQPQDIEQKVRELTLQYISSSNSIIVAVIAADCNIAKSETMMLAQKVDPLGIRTVLVISKIDLLEETVNISDILSARRLISPLHTIGVINRSQRDIQQGKTIAESVTDESAFFKSNYPNLAAKHGIPFLAKALQYLILDRIRSYLPQLRSTVASMANQYQNILNGLGEPVIDKGQTILNMLTNYCSIFTSCIKGNSNNLETSELSGGARISYIFQESFCSALDSIDPLKGYNKAKILTAMRNASGTSPAVFIPELSFELLVKKQIKKLEEPSLQCADLVYQELERLIVTTATKCGTNNLHRFCNLHRRILDISSDMIRLRIPETHDTIRKLIEMQMAHINKCHPDFIKDVMLIKNDILFGNTNVVQNEESCTGIVHRNNKVVHIFDTREHSDCVIIENLIKCYFNVVRKNIQDYVPKAIMYCLVNYIIDNLQQQLVSQLYQPHKFDELLIESKYVIDKRKETNDIIKGFDKATEVINEIRDFNNTLLN